MDNQILETCCINLQSSKIIERKRAQETLDDLLDKSSTIKFLNNNRNRGVTWNDIVRAVHLHLIKESDLKKNQRKKTNADILVHVVKKANNGEPRVSVANLVQYVLECFESTLLKEFYFNTYIRLLKDHILTQPSYLSLIGEYDWIAILTSLKSIALQENCEDTKVIECIKLIFQHGPKHNFPILKFRSNFDFVTNLCKNLRRSLPTRYKAEVFQIVIDYCKYNAPDCCMSCCKLGEEVFGNLRQLYERRVADDSIKTLLFEFCLLQIRIHHPYGATSNASEAYAYNWDEWRKHLRLIYSIVEEELNYYTKTTTKPPFVYKSDSVFVLLAVAVCKQVFLNDVNDSFSSSMIFDTSFSDSTQPSKRFKLNEVGLGQFMSYLKESKSYPRIFILTQLLKTYPEVINFDQSVELLDILVNMYKEVKNEHIYDCFEAVLEIQSKNFPDRIFEVDETWNFIGDEILRSLGIHQNGNSIHSLLQSLIHYKNIKDPSIIYQTFLSGSLNLEDYTIKTLSFTIKYFGIPDLINGENFKKKLIKWFTNYDVSKPKIFSGDETLFAQTIISLCLKQTPDYKQINDNYQERNFEDVFLLNAFQKLIKPPEKLPENQQSISFSFHKDIFTELINSLKEFLSHFISINYDLPYLQNSISAVILTGYVLTEINALKIQNFELNTLLQELRIEEVFSSINEILYYYCSDDNLNRSKIFIDTLKVFNNLLTKKFDAVICKKFRSYITTQLLSCFFEMVNVSDELNKSREDITEEVMVTIDKDVINERTEEFTNILCNFSMYEGDGKLTEIEEKVISSLTQSEDHSMLETVLKSIKNCQIGTLTEDMLQNIMVFLSTMWRDDSKEYKTGLNILEVLQNLTHHIGYHSSDHLNQQYFALLINVYNHQDKYGYKLSIELLECYKLIIKNNFFPTYKKLTSYCLSVHICNFLKSNYQLVRLKAIECLSIILSSNDPSFYTLQKNIYNTINTVSREVFVITEKINEERTLDESVSRTCSVFQTYCSLIFANSIWRKSLLYSLLSLTLDKKLNGDLLKKALSLIAEELNFKTLDEFIGEYVNYLLSQWCLNNRELQNFPYELLGSISYKDFLKNHMKIILPLQSSDNIESICTEMGLSKKEVFQSCFVEVLVGCFLKMTTKSLNYKEFNEGYELYNQIVEEFSENHVKELIITNIDNILISIMTQVVDEKLLKTYFGVENTLEHNEYSASCINETLNTIASKIQVEEEFLKHCISKYPEKIQTVLLKLSLNVYTTSSGQQKLKCLHQYFIFIDSITPFIIISDSKMTDFFIRTIVYSLLYFVEMKTDTSFKTASLGYLQSFITTIISHCHKKLEDFFGVITTKLLFFTSNKELSQKCITILKLLIIENEVYFENIIPNLDPFPEIDECGISLKGEIEHFLDAGSSNLCRLEALKQLKNKLAENKIELKEMFEITNNVRDFSEERERSTLHRLLSLLVKFISSDNKNVSIESARCLGEIGASNLTTLILQTENITIDTSSSPIQLITSHLIKILYQCIINEDIFVIQHASQVLYKVLSTKEGLNVIKNIGDSFNISYLYPYLPKQQRLPSALQDLDKKHSSENMLNVANIWWYTENDHKMWLTNLTCVFLQCFPESSYLQSLIPLCKINVSICENLLPYLIYLYASLKSSKLNTLSEQINYFFDNVWELSLKEKINDANKTLSTQCMLDVISFYRTHSKNNHIESLDLDYLKLAQAAFYCSRFFDAIFYIELWCQAKAEEIAPTKTFTGSPLSLLDLVCAEEPSSVRLIAQNILRRSYSEIGEVDGLNGCGHAFLLDASTRIDFYKELGRWDEVTLHYDTLLSQGNSNIQQNIAEALMNCGYYALATNYHEVNNLNYDVLWRLGRYDCDTRQESDNPFERQKYIALKWLFEKDTDMFSNAIYEARSAVIKTCKGINLQTTKGLYGILTNLQMLQELEDVEKMNFDSLMKRWEVQDSIPKVDFKTYEPIKAQRIALLSGFLKNTELNANINVDQCKEYLADLYLDVAALAREAKQFNIAKRAISSLSAINPLKPEYLYKKVLEEGKICWDMNDKITARYLIHELFTKNDDIRLNFASLKLYGQWMAESQSENPQIILNTYFLEPLKLMKSIEKDKEDFENIFGTYYDIARFSDLEYQRIRNYIKSAEFEQKVKNKEKSREAADKIRSQSGPKMNDDQKRAMTIYHKQSMIDEGEIDNTLKGRAIYLKLAIKYYMLNLQYSDVNNTRIFRVLSLWLENRTSEDLIKLLDEYVSKIPSYKFVPILPQLVPHLSNNSRDDFAKHISSIIERCARDHPYHTLPILISLANSNMDEDFVKMNAATDSNEARVEGAKSLLKKLTSESSLKEIITEMQTLSRAFLELAYLDTEKCKLFRGKSNTYVIPDSAKISKIRNLTHCCLPTITVDIRKDCEYKDIISIHSFKKEFMLVGGINRPKSILCQCSDGEVKRLLVKGKDDLRQDAVMQQVFTIMNDLFRNNKYTSKLLIRTYKVVPLSKRSGVLEWVENSQMIGEYLTRLHHKYRPDDWTVGKCQGKMKEIAGRSNEDKALVFKKVCENLKPVMNKFFQEKYPESSVWYERRRAYIRSLATTSICGYILGLGDRHGGNILLDENTAEVIHIDFGIAFEQGKLLPTPETVPFRLTRDLEDGMGVTGVNGIFKRSCEKTMEVLRQNWETIISILEVLLYDPLYAWTITPAEAYSRQNYDDCSPRGSMGFGSDDKENLNVTAERALLRLHQKLHGTEEGGSSSVEGQVEKLIQQARDHSNLSRLYYGWQAFL